MFKFVLILYDFYSYNFSSSNVNSKFSKFFKYLLKDSCFKPVCSSKTFSIPLTSTQTNHHKECELSGPLSAINSQVDTVFNWLYTNTFKGANSDPQCHSAFSIFVDNYKIAFRFVSLYQQPTPQHLF